MEPLERLVQQLSALPGVGKKSAARMAYTLLKADRAYLEGLGTSILTIQDHIKPCPQCRDFTTMSPCRICSSAKRERTRICVVEQPGDISRIEETGEYRGLYFVLNGVLAPLDGIGPEELGLELLKSRVQEEGISELILATNPTMEGDTTALYIKNMLKDLPVRLTRIATGLPVGSDLEYADQLSLGRALKGRLEYK